MARARRRLLRGGGVVRRRLTREERATLAAPLPASYRSLPQGEVDALWRTGSEVDRRRLGREGILPSWLRVSPNRAEKPQEQHAAPREQRGWCRICHERLPSGEVVCPRHETEPMDERWAGAPQSPNRARGAARPIGEVQKAIMAHLPTSGSVRYLTDVVARQADFRGVHYARIMSAAEALEKHGLVAYDGVRIQRLSQGNRANRALPPDKYSLLLTEHPGVPPAMLEDCYRKKRARAPKPKVADAYAECFDEIGAYMRPGNRARGRARTGRVEGLGVGQAVEMRGDLATYYGVVVGHEGGYVMVRWTNGPVTGVSPSNPNLRVVPPEYAGLGPAEWAIVRKHRGGSERVR